MFLWYYPTELSLTYELPLTYELHLTCEPRTPSSLEPSLLQGFTPLYNHAGITFLVFSASCSFLASTETIPQGLLIPRIINTLHGISLTLQGQKLSDHKRNSTNACLIKKWLFPHSTWNKIQSPYTILYTLHKLASVYLSAELLPS